VSKGSACDSLQEGVSPGLHGSHHLTNFDADCAVHAARRVVLIESRITAVIKMSFVFPGALFAKKFLITARQPSSQISARFNSLVRSRTCRLWNCRPCRDKNIV